MYIEVSPRSSGKTYRMIRHLVDVILKTGKKVLVVYPSTQYGRKSDIMLQISKYIKENNIYLRHKDIWEYVTVVSSNNRLIGIDCRKYGCVYFDEVYHMGEFDYNFIMDNGYYQGSPGYYEILKMLTKYNNGKYKKITRIAKLSKRVTL